MGDGDSCLFSSMCGFLFFVSFGAANLSHLCDGNVETKEEAAKEPLLFLKITQKIVLSLFPPPFPVN